MTHLTAGDVPGTAAEQLAPYAGRWITASIDGGGWVAVERLGSVEVPADVIAEGGFGNPVYMDVPKPVIIPARTLAELVQLLRTAALEEAVMSLNRDPVTSQRFHWLVAAAYGHDGPMIIGKPQPPMPGGGDQPIQAATEKEARAEVTARGGHFRQRPGEGGERGGR